jgi:hypothetical protein
VRRGVRLTTFYRKKNTLEELILRIGAKGLA